VAGSLSLSDDESKRERFKEFNERRNHQMCLDTPVYKRRLSDEEARVEIRKVLGEVEIPQVKSWPRMKRNEVEKSKKNWGVS
jgi:hypothetical protein